MLIGNISAIAQCGDSINLATMIAYKESLKEKVAEMSREIAISKAT